MSATMLFLLAMAAAPEPAELAWADQAVVSGIPAGSAAARRVDALLAALGTLDYDALATLFAPDAVFELPFAGAGVRVSGRAAIVQYLHDTMGRQIEGLKFTITARYTATEPGVQIVEFTSRGRRLAGDEFGNRLVAVIRLRGDQVTLFREYFNPAPVSHPAG